MKMRLMIAAALAMLILPFVSAEEPKPKETGTATGTIVEKDGSKLFIESEDGRHEYMPYWKGGMPADGGGLVKEMVEELKKYKVGDKVRVEWTMEERRRVDKIRKIGGGGEEPKEKREKKREGKKEKAE